MNSSTDKGSTKLLHQVEIEEHQQNGWHFIFTKSGIFSSKDIDMLADLLTLQHVPDIVFGNNMGVMINQTHKFALIINAKDALYFCNYNHRNKLYIDLPQKQSTTQVNHINIKPDDVKIKYTTQWANKNSNPNIKQLEHISDSFYQSPYKGSVVTQNQLVYWYNQFDDLKELQGKPILEGQFTQKSNNTYSDYLKFVFTDSPSDSGPKSEFTKEAIPIGNLTESNPILWACHIPLYEDELGDNGIVNCEFRFRVMKDCFFGLIRQYLRVDDVIIRIFDTRIYHDFSKNYILREFSLREGTWQQIHQNGFQFTPTWSINPQQSFQIQNFVPIIVDVKEKILFQ